MRLKDAPYLLFWLYLCFCGVFCVWIAFVTLFVDKLGY